MVGERLSPNHASPRFHYGYANVIIGFLVMLVTWGAYYSFGIFFKPLAEEFQWSRAATAGAFSIAMILQGVMAMLYGHLTDRRGPRISLTVCGLSVGIGYLLMTRVHSLLDFYLFYGLAMGIGMAGPFASILPTIARSFVQRRGLMTGIVAAGIGTGAVILPLMATYFIANYNWRVSYLIIGGLVLVVVVVGAQFMKRGMVGEPVPQAEAAPASPPIGTRGVLAGFMRTRQFWMYCGIFFCYGSCLFTLMVHIAPHATDMGINPAGAASIVSIIGAASIAGKIAMGHIADIIGGRLTFAIAFGGMSLSLFLLVPARELWMLQAAGALFGFAYSGCVAPQTHLINELFGPKWMGLILGIGIFVFTLSGSIGPLLAGYAFDTTDSYNAVWLTTGTITAVGILVSLLAQPSKHRGPG